MHPTTRFSFTGPRRRRDRTSRVSAALGVVASLGMLIPNLLAVNIWTEGFETDGNPSRYTTSGEFYTSSAAYFTRIEDTNGDTAGGESPAIDLDADDPADEYTGFTGQWYFAAEDTGSPDHRIIEFDPITTSGHENLSFFGDFAAGDTDSGPSYDSNHFIAILYSTDGGATYLPGLVFRHSGNNSGAQDATNQPLSQVNDIAPSGNNGITTLPQLGAQISTGVIAPDPPAIASIDDFIALDSNGFAAGGTALTTTLSTFSFTIPNAAQVCLRLVLDMDDGNAEVAFDNFKLEGDVLASNQAPTRLNTTADAVQEPEIGQTSYSFTVQYADDSAVDSSTIDLNDVTVTGPGMIGTVPLTGGTTSDPDGSPVTATYTFTPPGGSWDATDNGTYTIDVVANQVGDNDGTQLFVAAGSAGSFSVNATNTDPVLSKVIAEDVPGSQFGQTSYSFTIDYTDVGGIDASSIDANDVTVTSPGGVPAVTSLMGSTADPDGSPLVATYSFTPPGGTWDVTDDGTYTIAVAASQVMDVVGASVAAAATAGSFTVDSNDILCETFETDGSGTRYTITGGAEFTTGSNTYFSRIQDTNGNTAGGESPAIDLDDDIFDEYTAFLSEYYFAFEDVDSNGGSPFRVFDFPAVNTAGHSGIQFSGFFGAGDTDSGPSYDSDHFMAVLYSTDGGASYLPGLAFRANVSIFDATDHEFRQVNTIAPSGLNGVNSLTDLAAKFSAGTIVNSTASGDVFSFMNADSGGRAATGTVLLTSLQQFTFGIPGTPAMVALRVVVHSDSSSIEMAFDHLKLSGTYTGINAAPSVVNATAPDVGEAEIESTSYSFNVQYADDSGVDAHWR